MSLWLSQNWGTLLVGAVLLVILSAVALRLIQNKRKGKTSCGCGCEMCAMRDACHK